MKFFHLILITLLATTVVACKDTNAKQAHVGSSAPTATEVKAKGSEPAPAQLAEQMSGTVLESIDTAGYTYVKVKTADKEIWAAAPQFKVAVGDSVIIPEGMAMTNYHSKTLNRDFDVVYFVNNVLVPGADMALSAPASGGCTASMAKGDGSSHTKPAPLAVKVDFSGLAKAENGYTVAELFAKQQELGNKEVTLRAKVVKFSPRIMKTNWMHLQDGSGSVGTNDLTVTTDATANIGDTVLVKGVLDLNQDFGYGYKYDLIIQHAKVVVE